MALIIPDLGRSMAITNWTDACKLGDVCQLRAPFSIDSPLHPPAFNQEINTPVRRPVEEDSGRGSQFTKIKTSVLVVPKRAKHRDGIRPFLQA